MIVLFEKGQDFGMLVMAGVVSSRPASVLTASKHQTRASRRRGRRVGEDLVEKKGEQWGAKFRAQNTLREIWRGCGGGGGVV